MGSQHLARRPGSTPLAFPEFVAMIAAVMALQAFAIDAMLPALPQMAIDYHVQDANRLQWVVTAFIMGAGIGQLIYGPLSDSFGRRRVLLAGLSGYVVLSLLATLATDLDTMVGLRIAQGFAAASSSVIPRSIVRDRFEGATMSRVMSIIFMVFLLVPVLAPTIGQLVLLVLPWRAIFGVLAGSGAAVAVWVAVRLPETLHETHRRPLSLRALFDGAAYVAADRTSLCYTLAVTACLGGLLAYVSTVSQIFAMTFVRPGLMTVSFAVCASAMGVAAFTNARLVERLGPRRISHAAIVCFVVVSLTHTLIAAGTSEGIPTFVCLQALTMGCFGLCVPNFGAIAMQPMGAIAGTAASIQGFITMLGGAFVASAIGQQWSGSVVFLPAGTFVCGVVALGFVLLAERGALFSRRDGGSSRPLKPALEANHP